MRLVAAFNAGPPICLSPALLLLAFFLAWALGAFIGLFAARFTLRTSPEGYIFFRTSPEGYTVFGASPEGYAIGDGPRPSRVEGGVIVSFSGAVRSGRDMADPTFEEISQQIQGVG